MGYLHIDNLYKPKAQHILSFRACFALEKIHGTSAHVSWDGERVKLYSGGEKHDRFVELFDVHRLVERFKSHCEPNTTVFGEAYGGSQQGQCWRYGKDLKFVAFDVRVGSAWLDVRSAEEVVSRLGLEFVHYRLVPTDIESLNGERDAPSEQARRNGIEGDKPREGVVLRPPFEVTLNNGGRVIAKHKRDEERETSSTRPVVTDPSKLTRLVEAESIALEWVTWNRLDHVISKLGGELSVERTGEVISGMVEDVLREGEGEIVDSKEARSAIGKRTALLFKSKVKVL